MATFKSDGNRIIISGDITVSSGNALLTFLRSITPGSEPLTFDLKSTEKWDSSAIQMFMSFMNTHKPRKILWKNIPPVMQEDIKLLGITSLFNGENNG